MNKEEKLELEKLVIALDNQRRMQRGEIKQNELYGIFCDNLVKQLRKKYGITAKSWKPATPKRGKMES